MAFCRLLLAALIALGLSLAPVASALASSQALAKTAMEDCHGKAGKDCPCSDKASCAAQICAFKCYKLLATLSAPLTLLSIPVSPHELAHPQKPPDRLQRPHPPPPRS